MPNLKAGKAGRCCSARLELSVFALDNEGRSGAGFFFSAGSIGGAESGLSSEPGVGRRDRLKSVVVKSGVGDWRARLYVALCGRGDRSISTSWAPGDEDGTGAVIASTDGISTMK